jgi:hypothetical protein
MVGTFLAADAAEELVDVVEEANGVVGHGVPL